MSIQPHKLDPLQAWNIARSISAQSVSAVETARSQQPDGSTSVFDPQQFQQQYQQAKSEYDVWPYVSALQLHIVVYAGETATSSHDGLVSHVGEWIMDRLKESPAYQLTTETDTTTDETDAISPDTTDSPADEPGLSSSSHDDDRLAELAEELVTTSEHPDATYSDVEIVHDDLPSLRPAVLRMEVVNRATEQRDQHVKNVEDWLHELTESDTPQSRVQRQPMGVSPTNG